MILRSKEMNQKVGVINPDLIYPGQTLTFLFQDGAEISLVVEKNDNQWVIVRDKLSNLVVEHGPIVNFPPVVEVTQSEKKISFGWWWMILVFLVLALMFWLMFRTLKKVNVDPITAGPAQVPGGVNDASAYSRMREVIQSQFPGVNFVIKNIQRGLLSGLADVFYKGLQKPKKINLRKVLAYAGEILVNGKEQTIYFLQGCGNDARVGDYMSGGNLVFIPDVLINENGLESPLPTEIPVVAPAENPPVVTITDPGSEFHQQATSALTIVGKFLEGNDAKHKVTLKVTRDSVEAIIENKFDQTKK